MAESSDAESQSSHALLGGNCDTEKIGKAVPCCGCICCILLIVLPFASLRTVPPASVGVVSTFGAVSEGVLRSGTHLVNPFASVTVFSIKTKLYEEPSSVPTKEGLTVDLDIAMLYRIVPDKARDIFLRLGGEFEDTYMRPILSASVRDATGSVAAEALYNSTRELVQDKLTNSTAKLLEPRGIMVESILLKDIVLPEILRNAIEIKTAAQQNAERMKFVIEKEKREATRKKIEAGGIKDFQDIVTQGISEKLLQWKGIETTERMIDSTNAKIVMMGSPKGHLPLFGSAGV